MHIISNMNFKNKWLLAGIAAVILIVGIAAYLFIRGGGGNGPDIPITAEENTIKMSPEEIGLTLTPIKDGKEVEMIITKLEKVKSIEGSLEYEAVENGEQVSRGALVTLSESEVSEAKNDGGSITRQITIGTCSSGTCKYDKGVKEVTAQLRVNLVSGEVGSITQKVSLQ